MDNLLVRIYLIIEMIWRTGLAPWEFEFPFPDSLISTFLVTTPPGISTMQALSLAFYGALGGCGFLFQKLVDAKVYSNQKSLISTVFTNEWTMCGRGVEK